MFQQEQFAWLADKRENKYSQFGEDGILAAIFDRIGTSNKFCCECGASDGVLFSNTRKLIEEGWSSLQIEADEALFAKLAESYRNHKSVTCYNYMVAVSGAYSFDRLLKKVDAPFDLDLMVIDVDGQDIWLMNSLISHRPRVLMVEYDPDAAAVSFTPTIGGEGQAGLNAVIERGIGKYYWPVAITSTNVIFVQQELCGMLADQPYSASVRPCEGCGRPISDSIRGYCGDCYEGEKPESKVDRTCRHGVLTAATLEGLAHEGPKKSAPLLAAIMSTPRLGFLATMDCIYAGLMPMGVPLLRGEGAFWGQTLERAFEAAVKSGVKYILTFDYDGVFETAHGRNEIAKLVTLMEDNPDVDCIVAAQMKREKGPLLASSDKEIRLLDALVPITQGHFGLTIFKASALPQMPKPWLRDHPNENGEWNENRIDADIHFWKQAVEAGLNIQMSLDVMIGHLELMVTWPGQNFQTVHQSISEWREHGKPVEAFDRQRVIEAVKANPALLYGPKLDMGD